MAQFEKGNSKGGRKKGANGKTSKEVKEMIRKLVENNFDQLQADLNILTPVERINAYIKLLQFVIPKQQKADVTKSITTKTLIISPAVAPCKLI